jgi:hypothetical protein
MRSRGENGSGNAMSSYNKPHTIQFKWGGKEDREELRFHELLASAL